MKKVLAIILAALMLLSIVACNAKPDEEVVEEPEEVVEAAVVEAKPEIGVWRNIDDPSSLFSDPELTETASLIKNGMAAEDEDGTTLFAIPISADAPFPLMPVFRYGWSAMVEGKCCIVFRLKDGELI